MKNRDLVIFGASGHSKVIFDIVQRQNKYKIFGFCDDNEEKINLNIPQ